MEQSTADQILVGALLALGEHGVETLSMREISEAAGVSRGTLYRYFKSRGQGPPRSRSLRPASL